MFHICNIELCLESDSVSSDVNVYNFNPFWHGKGAALVVSVEGFYIP